LRESNKTGCIAQHINHVAIAVSDIEQTISFYVNTFGISQPEITNLQDHGVKAALVRVGGSQLEFIQPLQDTGGVASFIEKRGEGVHHICFEMDNLNQSLEKLQQAGINLIDKTTRDGLSGNIAFIHPKSTGGVLIELVDSESARR
jgi:methylmalonyl-CoA epimerase|tara:strand:- start:2547 stop:2984 length:438 start_codon:yes stop_codon:yes gene_type:complete